ARDCRASRRCVSDPDADVALRAGDPCSLAGAVLTGARGAMGRDPARGRINLDSTPPIGDDPARGPVVPDSRGGGGTDGCSTAAGATTSDSSPRSPSPCHPDRGETLLVLSDSTGRLRPDGGLSTPPRPSSPGFFTEGLNRDTNAITAPGPDPERSGDFSTLRESTASRSCRRRNHRFTTDADRFGSGAISPTTSASLAISGGSRTS
ncbi:MAG: hypothetical protein HQL73_06275, partial [Magnetococcales bacterium]|nr:hypothetical protein [Magnetococcales bacterium]